MDTQLLISSPKLSGTIRYSSQYQPMTIGQSAPILLIGHSDADRQQDTYRVSSMTDAINLLKADSRSPLLRALLEAYNGGCRDIWLYSIGPMSEYEPDVSKRNDVRVEWDNKTFYEIYHEKLELAYNVLQEYDIFQVVVPVEASFVETSDIDFITPLATLCENIRANTGQSTLGVIGTRAQAYNQDLIDLAVADTVFDTIGDKGKYVMTVWGEGLVAHSQMSNTYSGSIATMVGALICNTPISRSIFGINFRNVINIVGTDLSTAQKDQLTQSKINPVIRTQRSKRGQSYQTRLISDNTIAPDGSTFWSMNQMRTLSICVNTIKSYSQSYIGTTALESLKLIIRDFLTSLVVNNYIKDYSLLIRTNPREGMFYIDIGLIPIFGIRNIYFTVESGAGS